ncbi:MAG TPA: fluoride efflux transporter CrcB [Povalibacter sp.]|nr:fluoride efflux transporter CrcB [Povalibacter sp.]
MTYLLIALGSAIGGAARYWCSGFVAQRAGEVFPWGTLAVNVIGSFLIGALAAMSEPDGRWYLGSETRQFLMIGVLGGFTTFSSFSLQTLNLLRDGEWGYAAGNVAASLAACLVAVWLGFAAVAHFNQLRGP